MRLNPFLLATNTAICLVGLVLLNPVLCIASGSGLLGVLLLPFTTTSQETSASYSQHQEGKRHSKALAFGVANSKHLQIDMAQGQGEYLTSFATLLEIPEEEHWHAFMTAQRIYPRIWA